MKFQYTPRGVCSRQIIVDIDENDRETVNSITFVGGCNGNTQGVAALAEGMKIDEIVDRIEGIQCGPRATSCPDQLARALKAVQAELAQ